MKKILCVLPFVLLLSACDEDARKRAAEREARDVAMAADKGEYRRALFLECLKTVPQGPSSIHENGDWEGVVNACSTTSYYITNERFR